MKILVVRRRNP